MQAHITGIGGIFFRSKDVEGTKQWYNEHLGVKSESWGTMFAWRDYDDPKIAGSISWSPFKNETDYFGDSGQEFMINYRVRNMSALLESLKESGILPVKPFEDTEYGKFVWINDLDGRRIELWEPNDSAFGI